MHSNHIPNREVIRTIILEIEKQLEQPDEDSQKESEKKNKKYVSQGHLSPSLSHLHIH